MIDLLVIGDIHYVGPTGSEHTRPERKGRLALELAVRAIRDGLRTGNPDAIILMGDLLEEGNVSGAEEDLINIRNQLSAFGIPVIAVPGNHDRQPDRIRRIFERSIGLHEIAGCNLLVFADIYDEDDELASRPPGWRGELADAAAAGLPLIVLQHPVIIPQIGHKYPYNHSAAEELAEAYSEAGVHLSISGHFHEGVDMIKHGRTCFLTVPILCELPFPYLRVRMDGDIPDVSRAELAPSKMASLFDAHLHTQFAHCSEDITIAGARERLETFGSGKFAIIEHADQLYFPKEGFWKRRDTSTLEAIIKARDEGCYRHEDFRVLTRPMRSENTWLALEFEPEYEGRGLAALSEDIEGYDYIIGGIHFLNRGPETDLTVIEVRDRFMRFTEQLITSGIDILAHPFRYFRRRKLEVPREFFKPIARLLAEHSVAAEINYHTNSPDPEFFSICLELDIKLSIASDAHKLLEVGELKPHLEFLEMLGVTDQLDQVLWKPPFREVQ